MLVCDHCKKEPVKITLQFKTKKFAVCEKCALKIVAWLEKKPLKEQLGNLWDKTNRDINLSTIGGGI